MEHCTERISPKLATLYLNNFNTGNRKLRTGVVEKYAEDMRRGKWTACPEPISFYDDGELANGQHRLWAVIESGKTQTFFVLRGLPRDAGLNLDMGLARSLVDNAKITGTDTELTTAIVSAARAIAYGTRTGGHRKLRKAQSSSATLEVVEKYRVPATWVATHVRRAKYLSHGPILGAVGRAKLHDVDEERLIHFCRVLGSGFGEGEQDSAAIALRNYLLANGAKSSLTAFWQETFLRAQNAIRAFMQKRPIRVARVPDQEPYPLKE